MSGQVYGDGYAVVPEDILHADVSTNAKTLWAIFALHADAEGRSYPGRKRLAKIMRCSEDTVSRAKKELADAKLIECHERYDEAGRRTTDDVILRGARRNGAEYPRRTGAATELYPERTTTPTKSVGSCSSVAPRKHDPPKPNCARCAQPAMLQVDQHVDPKTFQPSGGIPVCVTCYESYNT